MYILITSFIQQNFKWAKKKRFKTKTNSVKGVQDKSTSTLFYKINNDLMTIKAQYVMFCDILHFLIITGYYLILISMIDIKVNFMRTKFAMLAVSRPRL